MKNNYLFQQKRLVYMAGESTEGPKSQTEGLKSQAEKPLSAIEDPYEAMNARLKIYENATKEADKIISDPNAGDKAKTAAQALKNRVQNARQNDKLPDRMFDATAESIDKGRQTLLDIANAPAQASQQQKKPGEVVMPEVTLRANVPTKPDNAPKTTAAAKPAAQPASRLSDAEAAKLSRELDTLGAETERALKAPPATARTETAPPLPPPPVERKKD